MPQTFKYRNNGGVHVEAARPDGAGSRSVPAKTTFETWVPDLDRRFPGKFERLPDDARVELPLAAAGGHAPAAPAAAPPAIQAMTVAELRQWAAEEEVDLGGAKTKDEILKLLNAHLAG